MRTKALLLIFSVTIIIYSNSLAGEFVWDDEYFVVKNPSIKTLANVVSFFTDPATTAVGDLSKDVYRPLTTLSYAVDYRIWRLNSFGYHLANVLLHAANALALFLLIYAMSGNPSLALFTALFFAAHPVQTEAVSWVSGRASVLFTLFYLSSLIFYIKYSKAKDKRLYMFSLLFFAASLFSREMAATLPLVIILYDIHFTAGEKLRNRALRYLSYFLITFAYVAVRYALLKRIGQFWGWGTPYETFLTMAAVLADYVKMLLFPLRLCANHLTPISASIVETRVFFSVAALAAAIALIPAIFRRSRIFSFAVCWFFITLLPVLNIIPIKTLKAERLLYLPSIGYCIVLALAIGRLGEVLARRYRMRAVAVSLACAIIAAYSLMTVMRNEDWKDTITISEKTIEASPLNHWALTSLGAYYINKGDYERAFAPLRKAVMLARDFYLAHQNLGVWYLHYERYDEAIREFKITLASRPDMSYARQGLGICYAMTKRYDEAEKEFTAVLKEEPTAMASFLNLGRLYEMKGDYAKSLIFYEKIIEHAKDGYDLAAAYLRIGDIYEKTGDTDKARAYYKKATDLSGYTLDEIRGITTERIRKGQ